jgi:hypothetical protein
MDVRGEKGGGTRRRFRIKVRTRIEDTVHMDAVQQITGPLLCCSPDRDIQLWRTNCSGTLHSSRLVALMHRPADEARCPDWAGQTT